MEQHTFSLDSRVIVPSPVTGLSSLATVVGADQTNTIGFTGWVKVRLDDIPYPERWYSPRYVKPATDENVLKIAERKAGGRGKRKVG